MDSNPRPSANPSVVGSNSSRGLSRGESSDAGVSSSERYPSRLSSMRSQDSGGFNNSRGPNPRRTSIFGRMSSTMSNPMSGAGGVGLRDSFFGRARPDPLEDSSLNEFNLTVIDEEGLIAQPGVEIITPHTWFRVGDEKWSNAGKIVVAIGVFMVLSTFSVTLASPRLPGYDIDPGLVLGSLQTLVLCTIVFISYHGVQIFQAHPNPIILFKCVIDIVLAVRFLLDPLLQGMGVYHPNVPSGSPEAAVNQAKADCAFLSGVTQFLYFTSECWYFVLIIDMYQSLTNPFTSVAGDRKKYVAAVCTAGTVSGLAVWWISGFHGFADGNYCWTDRGKTTDRNFWRLNVASWTVFYDWMIIFYLSGFAVLVFGMRRLRSGLKVTLDSRVEMLRNSAISIMSFTAYWTIAFTMYAISFSARTHFGTDGRMEPNMAFRSYSYTLAGRGMVDYFVWFMINKPSLMTAHWMRFQSESADKKFSAQLNTSLQRELIFFTIEGMAKAVQLADEDLVRTRERSPTQELVLGRGNDEEETKHSESGDRVSFQTPVNTPVKNLSSNEHEDTRSERSSRASAAPVAQAAEAPDAAAILGDPTPSRRSFLSHMGFPRAADTSSDLPGLKAPLGPGPPPQSAYTSEQKIRFTPYKSEAFAELRAACNIQTVDFLKSFETSTKPSISEGASGAFMFFSGDKRFIVKSMAESECRFLCDIADEYVEYLIKNPWSLITKFLGCFKITLYEKKFYFVVMENLFDVMEEGVTIHHRFDIKGSWVNRSYSRPRRGAKVKCRHCSMQFKYGAHKKLIQCPNVVGLHEPNVVLKDNDLRTRMRIGSEAGKELYEHLREDSLFLCSLGIMDYSLLLGVTDIEFLVDPPATEGDDKDADRPRSNTATSHRMTASTYSVTGTSSSSNDLRKTRANTGSSNALSLASSSDVPSSGGSHSRGLTMQDLAGMESTASTARATGTISARSLQVSDDRTSVVSASDSMSTQVIVPSMTRDKKSIRKSERVFGPGFYYIGIIDILQQWNTQKKLERFWKVHVQRCDPNGLSAIDPVRYQRRFEAKLREIIAIPKDPHRKRTISMGPNNNAASPSSDFATGGRNNFVYTDDAIARANSNAMQAAMGIVIEHDEDDEDDETLSLEHSGVRNPQPILMRVGSHPRSAVSGRSDSVQAV
jgi:1-phosphatidylinositol-4-phosphate 5-kinase